MKRVLIIFYSVSVVVALSCKNQKAEEFTNTVTDSVASRPDSVANIKTIPVSVEKKEPPKRHLTRELKTEKRRFVLHCFEHNNLIDFQKIEVYAGKNKVQTLPTDSAYAYYENEITFDLKDDANFDGYLDLKLSRWNGMVSTQYNFYLYQPKNGKYVLENSLKEITNPVFDKKTKSIYSEYHIGPDDYHHETYKWKNGKAVLMDK